MAGVVHQDIDEERFEMFMDRIRVEWDDAPLEAWEFMKARTERRIDGYQQSHRYARNAEMLSVKAREHFASW